MNTRCVKSLLAVIVGGFAGTGLRLLADTLIPLEWATLLVNVVGAFVLGLLVAMVWPRIPDWARAGLGAGMLGSFTTFSAVAVAVVTLDGGWSVLYLVVTMLLGLAAAFLGLWVGRRPSAPIDPVNE